MPSLWTCLEGIGTGMTGGLLSGLFGIGGGIVLIPLLGLLLGLNQHQAQGMSLAVMLLPNSLPAVIHYRREGIPLHLRLVLVMMAGFLGGIVAGARVATFIPDGPLRLGFAGFLALVALRILLKRGAPTAPAHSPLGWRRVALPGLLIGAVGGLSSGLLGIGGGVVMIPLMAWLLDLSQHEAQLASLTLLLPPLGLPGVWVYVRHQGSLPWVVLGCVALGFLLGAHLGARAATRLRGPRLQQAFACLLLGVALFLALHAH
jgi:uncharacterized protein